MSTLDTAVDNLAASASNDARASYSNYGTCLDLFAPGTAIRSAWYTSNTATSTLSGTSMAAPHVAGMAALYLQGTPAVTALEVANAIKGAATGGKIVDAGSGSPNLLLYAGIASASTPSGPPPSATLPVSVGALSGTAATVRNGWRATATMTVKDANGVTVPGAVVAGSFTAGGSAVSCTTAANGECSITSGNISKGKSDTTLTVTGITGTNLSFDASRNIASSVLIRKP